MFHVSYAAVINVPQDYPTIQGAIDAAIAGDTIQVSRRSGESQSVYYERLRVTKQLILAGESRETIIIDGGGIGTVIRMQADNVEIRGFTIRNGGQKYTGIRADAYSYVTIANNTVEMNKNGIILVNSHYNTVVQNLLFNNSAAGMSLSGSVGNNISDNNVSEGAYAIKLSSTNATFVVNNTVADNSYGIYLEASSNDTVDRNTLLRNSVDGIFPHACNDIVVSNNEISESAYGIQIYNSETITVLGNDAYDNSYGVYLAYSGPSNIVENNTISGNDWGASLYGSSSNTFKGNTLSHNTYGIDAVTESNNNLLYHNNFVENVEQVVWNPDCVNTWDNGYPSGGNYWSDYTGTDSNGDGIGDTAYIIDPMNKDRYPFMNPWGVPAHDVAIVNVSPSPTEVLPGEIVNITVIARNEGSETETFDVTTYYNSTATEWTEIETQSVTSLAPSADSALMFYWDTSDLSLGVYQIKAEAGVIAGETDTADNVYVDGTIEVLPLIRDVSIISVSPARSFAYARYCVNITVVTKNEGTTTETFEVTAYYDGSVIETQTVIDLARHTEQTLTFTWNTTGATPRMNYTISANATVLPGETDTIDNSLTDGEVRVRLAGDANDDGAINILDAIQTAIAFEIYDPNCDFNGDGVMDLFDSLILMSAFQS